MAGKELDSWIYVLIMIVISIFGFINKSRNKKELESNPPIDEEESDLEEPADAGYNGYWPEFKTEPAPFLDVELENVQPAVSVTPPQAIAVMPELTVELASVEFDDPEEIRKAIIYSEIMQRRF